MTVEFFSVILVIFLYYINLLVQNHFLFSLQVIFFHCFKIKIFKKILIELKFYVCVRVYWFFSYIISIKIAIYILFVRKRLIRCFHCLFGKTFPVKVFKPRVFYQLITITNRPESIFWFFFAQMKQKVL